MDDNMPITSAAVLIAALATGQPVGPHHVGCNVTEQFVEHWHPHLTIERHGAKVRVPADIGIVTSNARANTFMMFIPPDGLIAMVGRRGLEPRRPCGHTVLSRARLPFRHLPAIATKPGCALC